MSRLAVVAYPVMSEGDRRWIEAIRARHDPQALRLGAHVTLVFPVEMAEAALRALVESALRRSGPISMVLRRTAVAADAMAGGHSISLLVEEGREELIALHDALYGGALAAHRRRDVPFVPHVTVGAHRDAGECERLAVHLDAERRCVHARIATVDVVDVGAAVVRTVAALPLGPIGPIS